MYNRTRQKQTNIYTEKQVRRVITGAGIRVQSEVDSDFLIFCPYHNNYRTPAGEVSKERGTFFCFSCHESAPLVDLVMHVTDKSYFEAMRFIDSFSEESNILDEIEQTLERAEEETPPYDEIQIKRLHNQALNSPRALDYYKSRHITMESIVKFQLGYSEKQDMITMPAHSPDGKVYYGFVGRSVEGKTFINTSGPWRGRTFFNFHRARAFDTVYVVESIIDAIRLDQMGIPAIAVLGNRISKKQIELLTKHFNSVILVKDSDDGGDVMEKRMVEKLGNRALIIGLPARFHDVDDMTDEDIAELFRRTQDPILAIY